MSREHGDFAWFENSLAINSRKFFLQLEKEYPELFLFDCEAFDIDGKALGIEFCSIFFNKYRWDEAIRLFLTLTFADGNS